MENEVTGHEGLIETLQSQIIEIVSIAAPDASSFSLLDFPDHFNVGDNAIWLGELAFFRSAFGCNPTYVSTKDNVSWSAVENLPGPIFLHGGGNFGDLWPAHHHFRESVLDRFPSRPVIQLPQSIHFGDPAASARTARIIESHGNFTLLVRDKQSLEYASKVFDCTVQLCPDMAFCLGPLSRTRSPDIPLLCLLRADKEKAVADISAGDVLQTDWQVEGWTTRLGRRVVGRFINGSVSSYERAAHRRVMCGLDLLSSARVVISDRLHAHILCLLLGIPHVALDNSYGKVSGFIEQWTADSPIVRRAETLESGLGVAHLMLPQPDVECHG